MKWRRWLTSALAGALLLGGCAQNGLPFGTAINGEYGAMGGKLKGDFTPDWVKDAVFYQIFPERFANGDTKNDPQGVQPWGSQPTNSNFMGGDLEGVRQHIPYMKQLGINAIYFNPIFESSSNHKYNTMDYMKIDPHFGTNAQFKSLLDELHRNGIRVIIDGVFNHTGDDSVMFQDCVKNGPKSQYWNWYHIYGFPVVNSPKPNYDAWWGFGTLPKLMVANNPDVQNYLYNVTTYWTKMGIDGWRLDVPNEIGSDSFWQGFRQRVKAINPNAYIVGEIWDDGSHYVQGNMFDAVMNYAFQKQMVSFFANENESVDDFDAGLATIRNHYGPAVTQAEFNLLDSHDTPRFQTSAGNNPNRQKEAAFFQFVYPGAPVIYYGDELGMQGAMDPDNRRCMAWNTVQGNQMLAYYKKLIAIRKAHPALRGPVFQTLMRHNDFRLFAFVRADQTEKVVVALNSGKNATYDFSLNVAGVFPDGAKLVDFMTGKTYQVGTGGTLAIPGVATGTGVILGLAAGHR
ncbi:MAG TPA: alpha-amylase family glycosyl hydrolase [Oscillatoriaceae cyanobacterium]